MALTNIEFTIVFEGDSTVNYTNLLVATEEEARTFEVTVPSGYESYTLNARIQNGDDDIFLIPVTAGEFTLNADVLVEGNMYVQFELTSGDVRIVDNTIFIFGINNAIATDVTATTTADWRVGVDSHIADTDIHYSDATADGNYYVRKDNAWVLISGGAGDMYKATYDPTNVNDDAFDMDNMNNGVIYVKTENNYTDGEKSKLTGIEPGAEVNTVDSVNTQTGVVVLDTDDIAEGATNKYLTGNEYQIGTNDADDLVDGSTNAIITLTQETNFGTAYTHSQITTGNPHNVNKTDVGLGNVPNTDCTDADNISDGSTNAIITLTQETNFETAYSHISLTNNPHSVTASQAGALAETNYYYDNTGEMNPIWVKFASINIDGTYQKYNLMLRCGIGGNARDYGEIEIQINGSSAYNTFLTSTHYLSTARETFFADDTFMYVATDNGSNDYDIDFWVKVEAYAYFHCTLMDRYVESLTETFLLPTSPTTSGTEPSGATYFTNRRDNQYTDSTYFLALGGETGLSITLTFNSSYDYFSLYINGLRMIQGRHYTISGTTVTFLYGYTLTVNDEVEYQINYNSIQ